MSSFYWIKRGLLVYLFLFLTACNSPESAVVRDRSLITITPDFLAGVTFFDDFDRPNTYPGDLGINTEGFTWDLRGPYGSEYPLPPARDGFILGNVYTYSGLASPDSVVYANQSLRDNVLRLGAIGRWVAGGSGSARTSIAIIISANDNLISDMLHFTISRSFWRLELRIEGGAFETVAEQSFNPRLELGYDYFFDLSVADDLETVKITTPNGKITITDNRVTELLGRYCIWELYPNGDDTLDTFQFNAVWAKEVLQPELPTSIYQLFFQSLK